MTDCLCVTLGSLVHHQAEVRVELGFVQLHSPLSHENDRPGCEMGSRLLQSGHQIEHCLVENPVGILDDAAVYASMNSEGNSELADLSDTHTPG